MTTGASLCDSVYEYIQGKLLSGELTAGSRIAEQAIATSLGVSRTPVREALQLLDREGVVESVPRFGTVIRTPSRKEISDLYELRVALETYAAAKAARSVPGDVFKQMQMLNRNLMLIGKELKAKGLKFCTKEMFERYLAFDMAFHMMLIEGTDNERIRRLVKESRIFTRIFCSRRSDECGIDSIAAAYRAHARVLRAIANQDPALAQQAMAEHIDYSRDRSIEYYDAKYGKDKNATFESLAMPKDLLQHLKGIS